MNYICEFTSLPAICIFFRTGLRTGWEVGMRMECSTHFNIHDQLSDLALWNINNVSLQRKKFNDVSHLMRSTCIIFVCEISDKEKSP